MVRWLNARGLKGSLEEMEQAYLASKGYDNWPDYLVDPEQPGYWM